MIAALLESARAHVCATCGRQGRIGVDGFQYVTAPSSPYLHPLVTAVVCSEGCEGKAIEKHAVKVRTAKKEKAA